MMKFMLMSSLGCWRLISSVILVTLGHPKKHPQHIDLAILRLWSRHHKVTNKMCQQKVTNKRFHQIHVKNIIIFEMLTEMNLTTGFLIFPVNVNLLALRIENVFTVYVCTVNEFHNF